MISGTSSRKAPLSSRATSTECREYARHVDEDEMFHIPFLLRLFIATLAAAIAIDPANASTSRWSFEQDEELPYVVRLARGCNAGGAVHDPVHPAHRAS